MRIPSEQAYRQNVERLSTAHASLGRDALVKMSSAELGVLYAEKSVDLRIANNRLREHPHDELTQLRRDQADAAVKDIGGFIKEMERKERGPEMER